MDLHGRQPRGCRLRRGRASQASQIYLATTVTAGRTPLFRDLHLGRAVVRAMRFQHERGFVTSMAFVVMPDHLHWLFQLGESKTLSEVMYSVKRFSTLEINGLRGRDGVGVWQRGFHDHALRKEEAIKSVARYIVANPLRAGLVASVRDYPLWDAMWL